MKLGKARLGLSPAIELLGSLIVVIIYVSDFSFVLSFSNEPLSRFPFYIVGFACLIFLILRKRLTSGFENGFLVKGMGLLFASMVLLSAISYLRFAARLDAGDFSSKFFAAIIVPIYFGLIGIYVARSRGRYFYVGTVVSAAIFVGLALYSNFESISKGDVFRPSYFRADDDYLLDMHFFADYFVSLSIIYWAQGRKGARILTLMSLAGAVLLGSRSPVVFCVIVMSASWIVRSIWRGIGPKTLFVISVMLAVPLVVGLAGGLKFDSDSVMERVTNVGGYSQSYSDREEILDQSLSYMSGCLITGCFPFEDIFMGDKGKYIHNWGSFAASFGFPVFSYFVAISLVCAVLALSSRWRFELLFPVFLFFALNIAFSRSYVWPFWAMLMLYVLCFSRGSLQFYASRD